MGHGIKAVLFDIGETLLVFGRVHKARLFQQGAKLTYNYLKDLNQPTGSFKSYCWRNLWALRRQYFISNLTGNDFDALELLKKINSRKGVNLTDRQWTELVWLWYEPLSKIAYTEPDITETLTKLKDMGLKLGILSNTFAPGSSLEKHFQQAGILDFFGVRMYSYQFDFRKPDPRIFKIAAERIGCEFENIIFVGDRLDNDIYPALKLGVTAVLKNAYTNNGLPTPKGAYRIDNLSELPPLIQKINV